MIKSIEEGRKEDGNRSIADKIIKRLHDLEKTVENNYGRWAWELLQNAKDSIAEENNRKVSIQIELLDDKIFFRHNGKRFTEKDVRGLINQISSKEIEEGEKPKRTGKFGTGFLTTHILSKVINVKGILETIDNDFYSFEFPLDREGKTTSQLVPKIEKAWSSFHKSAEKISETYNRDDFNTEFSYSLETDEQKNISKKGVEEFSELIPYVLTFIPLIAEVQIINRIEESEISFKANKFKKTESVAEINQTINGIEKSIHILNVSNDRVSIAVKLEKKDTGYFIEDISKVPKLFCDFPLIGSENFHFPMIVNSFYFNPLTERDGIWLKGDTDSEVLENKQLLENAIELYKEVISQISEQNYFQFYNISGTKIPSTNEKYFDSNWYSSNIQNPLRDFILNEKLVEIENTSTEKKSIKDLWFPSKSYTKEIQEKIWQYNFDLFPDTVCRKSHFYNWSMIAWSKWNTLDYDELVSDIEKQKDISKLSQTLLKDESDTFKWYNSLCEFLLEDDVNLALFERNAITPNQNGIFKKKSELFIDKINDSELINILELLGDDWKDILINRNVGFGKYYVKEKKDIAAVLTEKLKKPSYNNTDFIKSISILSEWFENNPKEAKEYFSELHRRRAELFMNTIKDKESLYKVMRSKTDLAQLSNIAKALEDNPDLIDDVKTHKEIISLLSDFNFTNISELRNALILAKINNNNGIKTEITQDVLVSLGITSIEELEEALKDRDLSAIFEHTSTPNVAFFLKAQRLISRAKANIIKHLKAHPKYDCSEIEDLATTVIGGIKKEGVDIYVVIRPSDNGQVIVYYSSEKDTLDSENAELWIDNGIDKPRQLTLGKVLKSIGINKIPV